MEICKRYALGPNPVQLQILSEKNFQDEPANYLSQFLSVDLPIFSIHGNHDDPTREGGGDLLAALDLLSVAGHINYFGRQDQVDKIEIRPILLQKGESRVAIYGMGALRNERLNRMWQGKKVRFVRPEERDDEPKWFNMFVLHQNRDYGRGSKNFIHESMIPDWMDFVIWGHEHESRIHPNESCVGTFRITQPGSSVATSLTAGEAVRKHIGILDIREEQFRMHPIPLTQVRGFHIGELRLDSCDLDPEDPKIDRKVQAALEEQTNVLKLDARNEYKELLEEAAKEGNDVEELDIKYKLEKPEHVLVRLKVEHSGFSTMSNQRFGANFVGEVANPSDILLFHRSKVSQEGGASRGGKRKGSSALDTPLVPQDLEEMNVEDLIKENLEAAEKKLDIFDEIKLSAALDEFVSKEARLSISDAADTMLKKQQKKLIKREQEEVEEEEEEEEDDDEMEDEEDSPKKNRAKKTTAKKSGAKKKKIDSESEDDEPPPPVRGRKKKVVELDSDDEEERRPAKKKAPRKKVDSDDDDDVPPTRPKKKVAATKPTRGRRATKAKPKYAVDEDDEISDEGLPDDANEFVNLDDDEEEVKNTPSRRGKAKKELSQSQLSFTSVRKQKTSARPVAASGRKGRKKRSYAEDDSDEDEDFGASYGVEEDWGSARTNTSRRR